MTHQEIALAARCQWFFKPNYRCSESATWAHPAIIEGSVVMLQYCETHKAAMQEQLAVALKDWPDILERDRKQWTPINQKETNAVL